MPTSYIRESIEFEEIELDPNGFAAIVKRVNLREGYRHRVAQVDLFQDSIPQHTGDPSIGLYAEAAISPYQVIPTQMNLKSTGTALGLRMPAAANDTILFKATSALRENEFSQLFQFPSPELAANPVYAFYSNALYITLYLHGEASQQVRGLCLSFYLALDNKKVDSLEAGIGILREQHEGHCMELMSNGHMVSQAVLRGNTFPMWRYGGIRPEFMTKVTGSGGFFLPIASRDEETMQDTTTIRSAVAASRSMSAFDSAFGSPAPSPTPDWLRFNLVQGLVSGAVRDQWPPVKKFDNGNGMML